MAKENGRSLSDNLRAFGWGAAAELSSIVPIMGLQQALNYDFMNVPSYYAGRSTANWGIVAGAIGLGYYLGNKG